MARSQGNPFYVEELLNYVHGQGVDPQDDAALRDLELPESLHSLILSRVDTLGRGAATHAEGRERRRTRRSSRPPCPPSIRSSGQRPTSMRDLMVLRALDLVALDREDEQSYIFKHVVTQEVAYESMPFSIRAMLHERVGDHIEATEADAIGLQLDLLAHHYWHSENLAKKREYLVRAGEAAEASYANAAAIDYLERAAPLVPAERAGRTPAAARQGPGARRRLAARRGGRARGTRERPRARRCSRREPGARRRLPRWHASKVDTTRR